MDRGHMDRNGVGLVCALLLLIHYGNGADLVITSPNPSPTLLSGDTINLTISYNSAPSLIIWTVNSSIVVVWTFGIESIAASYNHRVTLEHKQLLINSTTTADSGQYMVRVNDTNENSGIFTFNVVVRDRVQVIQSKDTGIYKTGENISLTIWYEGNPLGIFWNYNGNPLFIKTTGYDYISAKFQKRLIVTENGSLLIYSTTNEDAGHYSINVTTTFVPGTRSFQVKFYDIIRNVTVLQMPSTIIEGSTPIVNLSCRASSGSGSVTWQKDGQPVKNDSTHVLLDQDLQIMHPNRTFFGTYSCNMSNLVSWEVGSINMTVCYPVENVTVTQSPLMASERDSLVNLSCGASSGYIGAVTWMKDGQILFHKNNTLRLLDGNQTLQIIQPNRTFSGNYSCNISNAVYWGSESLQLRVYDPVPNVKVTQSPQEVREGAAFVNLSCNASSGYIEAVAWMKDGQSVVSKNSYSLLDGNQTLQITRPNRTFNGIYTCNMSNAAYRGSGSLTLTVSYATLRATSTFATTITSLLAGILLAH